MEKQDLQGLLSLLKTRWTPQQILGLLSSRHEDAKKVALLAVGLVGTKCCLPALADRLKDADPMTNQVAEHALWSIWFRCGAPEANALVSRGAEALGRREFDRAEKLWVPCGAFWTTSGVGRPPLYPSIRYPSDTAADFGRKRPPKTGGRIGRKLLSFN